MKKIQIIGITGSAYAGKDTVADYLMTLLPEYRKTSFATPMKNMLKVGLGLTHEQLNTAEKEMVDPRYGRSPRFMMQQLGTDWGRNLINSDLWVLALDNYIGSTMVIIPDVRMENEAAYVRERGVLIHLEGRGGIDSDHKSEEGVAKHSDDYVINNNSSIDALKCRLALWVNR